jgi:hypothetical protein
MRRTRLRRRKTLRAPKRKLRLQKKSSQMSQIKLMKRFYRAYE